LNYRTYAIREMIPKIKVECVVRHLYFRSSKFYALVQAVSYYFETEAPLVLGMEQGWLLPKASG